MNNSSNLYRAGVIGVVFIAVTAFGVKLFTRNSDNGDLLVIASVIAPVISYVVSLAVIEATMIVRLLFQLLLFPFRLLGIGRKRQKEQKEMETRSTPRSFGSAAILVSLFFYGSAGYFLIYFRDIDFPFPAYCLIGFGWGFLLYRAYQGGIVDELESEY